MSSEVASVDLNGAARDSLSSALDGAVAPADFAPDADLAADYGLTSLNKVLFLTALCEDVGVSLSHLTEEDVARMHTLRDVVDALSGIVGRQQEA
ncbi:phosphopantetheine-binding protein [Salinispora oceanensis]|uniref:phosphopantetheine-binding protein n=1 Tax=Salinispora oceanensis TaxID=1050199 RepID=UPI0003620CEC|nr:phosphopantetheine-binding protein [Salinispora oceanensis]